MRKLLGGAVCVLLAGSIAVAQQRPTAGALSAATRQKLIDSMNRGAAYLEQQQRADGTWENHPGITAMAAAALLRQPGVNKDQTLQTIGKTLDYLHGLAKPDG